MITQAEVLRMFYYREDGVLIRKEHASNFNGKIGDLAGTICSPDYTRIYIKGRPYYLHRLIFLYHHGYMPENDVDHIDRNPRNNRVENLREVTRQCNIRNAGVQSNNKSGVRGVNLYRNGTWEARIKVSGKVIYLGRYADFTDAVMVRWKKEVELNWAGCDSASPAYLYLKERNLV